MARPAPRGPARLPPKCAHAQRPGGRGYAGRHHGSISGRSGADGMGRGHAAGRVSRRRAAAGSPCRRRSGDGRRGGMGGPAWWRCRRPGRRAAAHRPRRRPSGRGFRRGRRRDRECRRPQSPRGAGRLHDRRGRRPPDQRHVRNRFHRIPPHGRGAEVAGRPGRAWGWKAPPHRARRPRGAGRAPGGLPAPVSGESRGPAGRTAG